MTDKNPTRIKNFARKLKFSVLASLGLMAGSIGVSEIIHDQNVKTGKDFPYTEKEAKELGKRVHMVDSYTTAPKNMEEMMKKNGFYLGSDVIYNDHGCIYSTICDAQGKPCGAADIGVDKKYGIVLVKTITPTTDDFKNFCDNNFKKTGKVYMGHNPKLTPAENLRLGDRYQQTLNIRNQKYSFGTYR